MEGASKTRLQKKLSKCKLDDVTRDPEDWITELESLRGKIRELRVIIDDTEIITHIMPNLPEEYENSNENLKDKLNDEIDMLTIKRIWDKIADKYNKTNAKYNKNKGK